MSNALNRLRHHLKDDLFVRGADGMMPTPRALDLAEPVRAALPSGGETRVPIRGLRKVISERMLGMPREPR